MRDDSNYYPYNKKRNDLPLKKKNIFNGVILLM